jgi:hypothetical protein
MPEPSEELVSALGSTPKMNSKSIFVQGQLGECRCSLPPVSPSFSVPPWVRGLNSKGGDGDVLFRNSGHMDDSSSGIKVMTELLAVIDGIGTLNKVGSVDISMVVLIDSSKFKTETEKNNSNKVN